MPETRPGSTRPVPPAGTPDKPLPPKLQAVYDDVVGCRLCPRLVEWRELVATEKRAAYADETYWGRPVPAFGDPDASIVIVGLAPAAHGANRTGRMFTGDRSGDFLYAALHRAGYANQPESVAAGDGLELRDVWITAPVRCAPPANKPTASEQANCRGYLDREMAALDEARVVVALGGIALAALSRLWELSPRPRFGHGVEVPVPAGGGRARAMTILCSYHVSQQNTFTGKLTPQMFDDVLRRAGELAL